MLFLLSNFIIRIKSIDIYGNDPLPLSRSPRLNSRTKEEMLPWTIHPLSLFHTLFRTGTLYTLAFPEGLKRGQQPSRSWRSLEVQREGGWIRDIDRPRRLLQLNSHADAWLQSECGIRSSQHGKYVHEIRFTFV